MTHVTCKYLDCSWGASLFLKCCSNRGVFLQPSTIGLDRFFSACIRQSAYFWPDSNFLTGVGYCQKIRLPITCNAAPSRFSLTAVQWGQALIPALSDGAEFHGEETNEPPKCCSSLQHREALRTLQTWFWAVRLVSSPLQTLLSSLSLLPPLSPSLPLSHFPNNQLPPSFLSADAVVLHQLERISFKYF